MCYKALIVMVALIQRGTTLLFAGFQFDQIHKVANWTRIIGRAEVWRSRLPFLAQFNLAAGCKLALRLLG
jgi:hypothetical protein